MLIVGFARYNAHIPKATCNFHMPNPIVVIAADAAIVMCPSHKTTQGLTTEYIAPSSRQRALEYVKRIKL